jgi:hypothetical protein
MTKLLYPKEAVVTTKLICYMAAWTFRTYISSSGRSEVEDWYRSLAAADRAKVFVRLQHLRDTPRSGWAPIYTPYTDFGGMGRIRVGRYRMVGFFGPVANSFTFVHVFVKKQPTIPKHVRTMCINRRIEIEANEDRCNEWLVEG